MQKFLDHPGPTIYLAMTSTPPGQVRTAIAELSRLDVRILVAGTIHDLGDLATDRILIERVLPSHLVMPQVDLAVTTGGQGSVQTAMACGTPLLGIPLHIEQDLNVALVERLGAARHLGPPATWPTWPARCSTTPATTKPPNESRSCTPPSTAPPKPQASSPSRSDHTKRYGTVRAW